MSTKTTFKRVALVAVAALGLGVLSVTPSQATIAADSLTLSATTAAITTADTSTAVTATLSFAGTTDIDSISVQADFVSGPAVFKPYLVLAETSSVTIDGVAAPAPGRVVYPSETTTVLSKSSSAFVSAKWNIVLASASDITKAATTAGTYVIKLTPKAQGSGVLVGSTAQTLTITVTTSPALDPVAKSATVYLNEGETLSATADATVTAGGATLSISPNLASSPADNAAITFLTANRTGSSKNRFEKYRIGTTEKVAGVDSVNAPFLYDNTTFRALNEAPSEVLAAEHICWFKNQMFFAKGDILTFTAPFSDDDFSAANGAGSINIGSAITGLIVFREQLIIFSQQRISRLVGNTIADFQLQPITLNIGCIDTDTIQEIGSDIMFLGPDGLRLLTGTDKFGDFSLAVVSKSIQSEMTSFIASSSSFCSVVIREKSQYRLFGFSAAVTTQNAVGILGTQTVGNETGEISWAEMRGIRAFVADSDYFSRLETIVFAQTDGYVYKMESGSSFDGANIIATFSTPFVPMTDPRLRKTFYKLFLYTDPSGSVTTSANLKLDFDDEGVIQPDTITLSNDTGAVGFYGSPTATYGSARYGTKLKKLFQTQVVGSGFTVSLQFVSESTDPAFSLDAATLEYATFDRR
jgi:hypothetical protein